jgi:ParB family chromosome partitioning protein
MDENLQKHSSIFWIEVEKVKPNPMQPRREFDMDKLMGLADSIKQYGVLQPLVVTRKEIELPYGRSVEYELIAGERRLRASKLAGLFQVPVIIREDTEDKIKLELAIIENLQRENLNPIERALAFKDLIDKFNLKHHEVGFKMGKSRVFVTNTLRLLNLPEEMQKGLSEGIITEGHMRPILMLVGRENEQANLYKQIIEQGMTVREAERASRQIAQERALAKTLAADREISIIEDSLSETFGTRVKVRKNGKTRKLQIEFFSDEELNDFLSRIAGGKADETEQINNMSEFGEAKTIGNNEDSEENVFSPIESSPPEDDSELISNFSL